VAAELWSVNPNDEIFSRLSKLAKKVFHAFGLQAGIGHLEALVTSNGEIYVVEAAIRGGGFNLADLAQKQRLADAFVEQAIRNAEKVGVKLSRDAAEALVLGLRTGMQTNSPSRRTMQIGQDASDGAAIGFRQGVADLTPQAAVAGRNLANAFVMGQAGDLGISTLPPGPRSDKILAIPPSTPPCPNKLVTPPPSSPNGLG
jgi:hypothetical protein